MTQIEFVENEKSSNIDLVIKPFKKGTQPDEPTILQAFHDSKFKDHFFLQENLKNAVAELSEKLKPLQSGKPGKEFRYPIGQKKDAEISFTIDDDKMAAYAEITSAYAGKHFTAKEILTAAQEANIVKGFSKDALLKLAKLASIKEPGNEIKRQIAAGKYAINGKDGKIKQLVQTAQERILKPKEREDGSVDMKDLGDIMCVKTGDLLAQRIPPTDGKEGYTVTGDVLAPVAGNDVKINAGEGTKFSERDPNFVVSEIVGLPKFKGNDIMVDQVFQTKKVDVNTGHVRFEGSIIIDGDVGEGMQVSASGDITIGGFVESAYIEAGGDVTVQQGIIGRQLDTEQGMSADQEMSATIIANGSIYAKYAQYAELNADVDIHIETQMMHCRVDGKGKIWVGTHDKANGKLIGGYAFAGRSVHSGVIGAPAGSHTIFNFQSVFEKIHEKQALLESKTEIQNKKLSEIQALMKEVKAQPMTAENKKRLNKVVAAFQSTSNVLGEILNKQEMLERKLAQLQQKVYVEATEKLYHGVTTQIGDFTERSRREHGPSKMHYSERKILITPI